MEHWNDQDYKLILPHNPRHNNLKYLWDYSLEEANEIMTSPEWTRAIFVREPKQRFLSAFLDKAVSNDGWHVMKTCCHKALECKGIGPTRKEVTELLGVCHLDAWDSRRNVIVPQWNIDERCCKETKEYREKSETIEGFLETIETCHDEHWGEFPTVLAPSLPPPSSVDSPRFYSIRPITVPQSYRIKTKILESHQFRGSYGVFERRHETTS